MTPTPVPAYERMNVDMDVSVIAVQWALGRVGYELPKLYVSTMYLGWAMELNAALGHLCNIEIIHGATDPDEWWVEFGGKRAGSTGA